LAGTRPLTYAITLERFVLREQFGCADIADSFSNHLALEKKRFPQSGANAQLHENRSYDVEAQPDHGTPCLSELEYFSGSHCAVVLSCALTSPMSGRASGRRPLAKVRLEWLVRTLWVHLSLRFPFR
jgi:hypothetical protein